MNNCVPIAIDISLYLGHDSPIRFFLGFFLLSFNIGVIFPTSSSFAS